MNPVNETVLQISERSLLHNFEYLKSKTKSGTKILAVVKAFAYGLDPISVAKILDDKVDYFAVAYAKEGMVLRNAGIQSPILVLHPQEVNFELMVKYDLEPSLYSTRIFDGFLKKLEELEIFSYPIHLKFNTGLNRLGFNFNDISYLIKNISSNQKVKLKSVFSHLSASEDLNEKEFSENQISTFNQIKKEFDQQFIERPDYHFSNTSGILNFPEIHFDMVRTGIGLYGFSNIDKELPNFKNVASLKSIISQIHKVSKGESVGYNRGFIAKSNMKIATIPIGHADGIPRSLGNHVGYVKIAGHKAYIVGNVCMDMIMVDVSNIDCDEGDEVVIFDCQEDVIRIASINQTIPYEVLTAISQRIKREIIYI